MVFSYSLFYKKILKKHNKKSVSLIIIYLELQEEFTKIYGKNTLVLMQIGSFHEAYSTNTRGHDLSKISNLLNILCTKKKQKYC